MAAPVKIGRALAALLLADLPHSIADMAENYGVKPPKVELKHGDRLSQGDARTLYAWAVGNPDFTAAYRNSQNPAHGVARAFLALTQHFIHEHPQSGGEPAPWPEPLSPAIAGLIAGTREKIEAAELTPAEARDMIAWARLQPDHAAALHSRAHAEHREVLAEWQALHQRASEGATTAEGSAPIAASNVQSSSPAAEAATQARIAELNQELRGNTRFGSAERRAKVAELAELLARGSGDTAGNATPSAAGALSGISATAAAISKPGATAAPGAAPPANRAAELTQALRGNSLFGSSDRRATLAALEAELLSGNGAGAGTGGTDTPAAG